MIKLRSKAYNLSILKKLLVGNKAYIPKFFYFKKEDYKKKKIILLIQLKYFKKKMISFLDHQQKVKMELKKLKRENIIQQF